LPFASFGLVALSNSVRDLITGTGDGNIWLGLLFGVVFTGVGVGLVFVAVYGRYLVQQQQSLEAQFPGQPWNWRDDWAAGRIESNVRSGTIGAWVFAALWNLVSSPLFWLVPHEAPQRGPIALIGLAFPAVGILLLIRAIRMSLELHEFGRTWFQMESVPGVVGRELKGTIHVRFPHTPEHGIHLQLSCVNRVVNGSGNSQSTWENILWRGESNLSAAQLYTGLAGTLIPVSFHIPWDAKQTEKVNPRSVILWLLEAKADVPEIDYHDVFEVPVFHTAQSPSKPEPIAEEIAEEAASAQPQAPTIVVRQTGSGTEFYFPAGRNTGFAASVTIFGAVFSLITVVLVRTHAPLIFPIAFGFFTLLLFYIVLQMWLETTRVVIGNSTLTVRDGWLGGGQPQEITFTEIDGISLRITAQQGGGTGTPYYDIELTRKDGHKITLGHTVKDKQEAEWLVAEMSRLAGQNQKAAGAGAS
jgi:hypothetical protein